MKVSLHWLQGYFEAPLPGTLVNKPNLLHVHIRRVHGVGERAIAVAYGAMSNPIDGIALEESGGKHPAATCYESNGHINFLRKLVDCQ